MPAHRYRAIRQSDDPVGHGRRSVDSGRVTSPTSTHSGSMMLGEPLPNDVDAHIGAMRAEASVKVYGRYSKWILFIA